MMKQKLTSRKFWVAVAGIVAGCMTVFGYASGAAETVSGAILIIGSGIGYMISEGMIDAARVGQMVQAGKDAAGALRDTEALPDKEAKKSA